MFNISTGPDPEFKDERVGYLFAYAQMSANQAIRFAELESRPEPKSPISRAKWSTGGKDAERLEIYISAILAASLFFEAYSFDYVARKKSTSFAKQYFDKLDPAARWLLGTSVFAPPGLDTSNQDFGRMADICRYRNKLVHNKTAEGGSFYPPPPIEVEFNPLACLEALVKFCELLYKLDNTESFARYVSAHVAIWMSDAARGVFDYPMIANVDP